MRILTASHRSGSTLLKSAAICCCAGFFALLVLHVASKADYERRIRATERNNVELSQQIADQAAELETVSAQLGEMKRLRREVEEIHQLRAGAGELERLKSDNRKLEGEVALLRSKLAQAQAQSTEFRKREMEFESVIRQSKLDQVATEEKQQCVAKLKQIEEAKRRWANLFKKGTDATPEAKDLFGRLANQPVCPSGGQYTIGTVAKPPTCSHPDHHP